MNTRGPYHHLYKKTHSLWEGHVGVFVEYYFERIWKQSGAAAPGRVLDLGAGEGDNGIYLAARGFEVDMVELSPAAKQNYERKLVLLPPALSSKLHYYCEPVGSRPLQPVYDLVITYGLLHCFQTHQQARRVADLAIRSLRQGGYIVLSCLTDSVLPGAEHEELRDCFLPSVGDVHQWFGSLAEVRSEVERIQESHSGGPLHEHEVFRAIYNLSEAS